MPVRGNTFKVFIGNLTERATADDLRKLFEVHGTIVEADVVKNFGFVHFEKEEEGKAAIEALNGHSLFGRNMVVEASSRSRKMGPQRTKIFVGNVHKDTKLEEIKRLFEVYGPVVEADILTNFAFIHMDDEEQAQNAIRNLDGYELHGLRLRVQQSTSRVRQQAGMSNPDMCYRCGSRGHWSKECPRDGSRGGGRYPDRERGRSFGGRYDPYPPPPPPSYMRDRFMRYRDEIDTYDRYERRYYDESPYPDSRRYGGLPPPPPMRDMYDRGSIPPPSMGDYMRYGRAASPTRYPPPPPQIRGYGRQSDRNPY